VRVCGGAGAGGLVCAGVGVWVWAGGEVWVCACVRVCGVRTEGGAGSVAAWERLPTSYGLPRASCPVPCRATALPPNPTPSHFRRVPCPRCTEVMAANDKRAATYGLGVDVYSFAIVLWELVTCEVPYSRAGSDGKHLHPIAILYRVSNEGMRPPLPAEGACVRAGFLQLMVDCWNQDPDQRPTFKGILARLDAIGHALDADGSSPASGSDATSAATAPGATSRGEDRGPAVAARAGDDDEDAAHTMASTDGY